jgi:hypothetical protein
MQIIQEFIKIWQNNIVNFVGLNRCRVIQNGVGADLRVCPGDVRKYIKIFSNVRIEI